MEGPETVTVRRDSGADDDSADKFQPFDKTERAQQVVQARPGQARFKFRVLKRYGPQCSVCEIKIKELLDAAHIIPKRDMGTDDPRNGLVLCANHHRAFDEYLFVVDPETLALQFRPKGPGPEALGVTKLNLQGMEAKPQQEALEWRWRQRK